MDGPVNEHSDSDSGESWTLLDNSPSYADEAPDFHEHADERDRGTAENVEKDEDTDGISIISDSEPESMTPCEHLNYEDNTPENTEIHPTEQNFYQNIATASNTTNILNEQKKSMGCEDDFLGDTAGKLKTYVHRRNKKLSTVLNIILLGSVITAAGVAIGHMWGVRDDCSLHTTPSINKILSNLYKLQEENAYLRNKIKELSIANNKQMKHRKVVAEKTAKQRCKKMFEEPLNNKNALKTTKCVDSDSSASGIFDNNSYEHEQEFIGDINKLKYIYKENKNWLDVEIAKRLKGEKTLNKEQKNEVLSGKEKDKKKTVKIENLKRNLEISEEVPRKIRNIEIVTEALIGPLNINFTEPQERKITYADSLKSEKDNVKTKSQIDEKPQNKSKGRNEKKVNKEKLIQAEASESDVQIMKDDRYVPKQKSDKKKYDRHKTYKKQKRKNKYEQWEMKGGYLKNYDVTSVSSTTNEFPMSSIDKNTMSQNFEQVNYMNQFSESCNAEDKETASKDVNKKNDVKDMSWYEKRAVLRMEARKRLENELFGDTNPNTAGWYFRRMQRREQCRAKGDNSTRRKFSRRNLNYKTRH